MTQFTRRRALKLATAATLVSPLLATIARAESHATVHAVTIKGNAFDPADITINAGDTITFTNEDRAPHTVTEVNGAFDTGRFGKGETATLMFPSAGRFDYFCAVHPSMKGTITIV